MPKKDMSKKVTTIKDMLKKDMPKKDKTIKDMPKEGVKLFVCPNCDKSYKTKKGCIKHVRFCIE
jgi:hypothetical protein